MQKEYFLETLNKLEFALRETLKAFACFSGALTAELSKEQPFTTTNSSPPSYDGENNTIKKPGQVCSGGIDGEDVLNLPIKKGDEEMFSIRDGHVRQKPNGTYEIRFRKFGQNKSFCAKKLSIAQEKFRIFLREFNKEFKKGNVDKKTKTLTYVSNLYLDKYRRYELAENSFAELQKLVALHVTSKIGNCYIKNITSLQIQELLTNLLNQGKGRTAEGVKSYLNGLFNIAKNLGYIKHDIMAGVKIPKHYRKKGIALTLEEEREFIAKIKGDHYEPIFLFLLYSGARISEAVKFKLSDVDFEKNTIRIRTTKIKDKVNGADRIIPIFPKLKTVLKSLSREEEFPFAKMANKAGQRFKAYLQDHHLHELRHTFTTRCRECRIDNEIVCLWTGHTFAGNTTSLVYTHFSMEYQQKTALRLKY